MTTKGLRYIQIRENAVREAIKNGIISLQHIEGTVNIADLFTKEDKNVAHFISIRDILVHDVFPINHFQSEAQPQGLRGVSNLTTQSGWE